MMVPDTESDTASEEREKRLSLWPSKLCRDGCVDVRSTIEGLKKTYI